VPGEQDDRVADHVPALGQEPDDELGIPCELKPVAGRRQRTDEPSLGARRRLTAPYRRPANCRRPCRLLSVSPHDHAFGLRSLCAISSPRAQNDGWRYAGHLRPHRRTDHNRSGYPFGTQSPVIPGESRGMAFSADRGEIRLFAGISLQNPALHALLAMQKVEGSNPFSRFL
jgi:hypothetical protein